MEVILLIKRQSKAIQKVLVVMECMCNKTYLYDINIDFRCMVSYHILINRKKTVRICSYNGLLSTFICTFKCFIATNWNCHSYLETILYKV